MYDYSHHKKEIEAILDYSAMNNFISFIHCENLTMKTFKPNQIQRQTKQTIQLTKIKNLEFYVI